MAQDGRSTSHSALGIVGVGASAGGIEALQGLLSQLPEDIPLAFILIPHLDPTHQSELVGILGRMTPLRVREATDGMPVSAGEVAVIPPNARLTIEEGVVRLAPRETREGVHHPIDHFFRSLADDAGPRAIGVILSGSLRDGALGLAAIKEAGGITFAQDPGSAGHDSMPRSAIASGAVDFVLSVERIAAELERIARSPYVGPLGEGGTPTPGPAEEEQAFLGVLRLLSAECGIDFTQYRQTTIRRRVARRMLLHRVDGLESYGRRLRSDAQELAALCQDLLIDVTRFFRDTPAWQALQQRVLPRVVRAALDSGQPIRCWVPGCATGEEPYSLAIVLIESLGDLRTPPTLQLFGSDASESAIARARRGVYPRNIEADVSEDRLRRFFTKVDGQYQVRKTVRDLCIFARHDILVDPPFASLDIVACRNLLIYLEAPAQKRVIRMFHYALKNDGILLLGASESLGPFSSVFHVEDQKHRIYSKKATSVRFDMGAVGSARSAGAPGARPRAAAAPGEPERDGASLQREMDRILLGRYAPPAVLVNDALEVLQFRGHTGRFLEPAPGQASLNLLRMAREGLLTTLRAALETARTERKAVRREGIAVRQNGGLARINLEVLPVSTAAGQRNYLVLFEEIRAAAGRASGRAARASRKDGAAAAADVEALQQELGSTREYLQSLIEEREAANEELRAANEEILSSNEELQSTNEELQTAKEELQSANEELHTVNDELQHRNTELTQLNDDLTNLLTNVDLPIVMIDDGCLIRRFTPPAAGLINLTPADVGRPLKAVRPALELPDLADTCARVVDTAIPSEREAPDREGRWWTVVVRPYRTAENRIAGALVLCSDVTALKQTLDETVLARDFAEGIVNGVRSPLLVLDRDLRIRSANPAFHERFRLGPDQTIGRSFFDLGGGWEEPELRRGLTAVAEENRELIDVEITREFEGLGRRALLLNARRMVWSDRPTETVLLGVEDVTGQREAERARAAALAAETAARVKDDFLATLSHELRTPLNAMMGWVRILRSGMLDPERTRHGLEVIERNTQLQTRLVEDLLDVSRLLAGKLRVDVRRLDVPWVIRAAVDAHRPEAEARGIALITSLDPGAEAVMADPARLEQILGTLIVNALKFTERGGRVEVRVARRGDEVAIAVSDTGRGISREALAQLFAPFPQVEPPSTRSHGGLGLGLAIARHLVALHGGTIRADSPGPGRGSTFVVTLPHAPAEAATGRSAADASPEAPAEPGAAADLEGVRILVVDDHQDTVAVVREILSSRGAEVVTASSTAEALDALARAVPAVLVTDLAMPGENGYTLLQRVRGLPPERGGRLPAVSMTAHAHPEERNRALAAGFDLHLAKPFEADELCAAVARLARRARQAAGRASGGQGG